MFDSVKDLKAELKQHFGDYIEDCEFDVGYMSPGHGMKGKQHQFKDDGDISAMYKEFQKKKNILLWIKCVVRQKRPASSDFDPAPLAERSGSVYDATVKKMHEVDVIVGELKSKHEGAYTPERSVVGQI